MTTVETVKEDPRWITSVCHLKDFADFGVSWTPPQLRVAIRTFMVLLAKLGLLIEALMSPPPMLRLASQLRNWLCSLMMVEKFSTQQATNSDSQGQGWRLAFSEVE